MIINALSHCPPMSRSRSPRYFRSRCSCSQRWRWAGGYILIGALSISMNSRIS